MSWDDRRTTGAVTTAVRQEAHSDDAKHRRDERTHVRARAKWVAPVAVGAAVVLVGGGAAIALTSRHAKGESLNAGAHPRQGTSTSPSASATGSSSATTPAGVGGRSFTLSGRAHTIVKAFHGTPGSVRDGPLTFTFTCSATGCTTTTLEGAPVTLQALGGGQYAVQLRQHDAAPPPADYQETFRLGVHGLTARYVITVPKGVYVVSRSGLSETIISPRTTTLTGPIHVTG